MTVEAVFTDSIIKVAASMESVIQVDAQIVSPVRQTTIADYTGDYEVTSFCADPLLTTSLILPTNDKHMLDDVTVYSVPTSEEYNSAGGVTFTIGG